MSRPRLLVLFCGAGGGSTGYDSIGFDVTGVDLHPMPRYPFRFIQSDAIEYLTEHWQEYDAFHASPPCQRYSAMSKCRPGLADTYPDLIGPVRELLQATGRPWVIENVPGSPLVNPVRLCGSHFGLSTQLHGERLILRRHRDFESNFELKSPGPCDHSSRAITVAGHGSGDKRFPGRGYAQACRMAMGIDWMTRDELAEAVPPAYTSYVGAAMLLALSRAHREDPYHIASAERSEHNAAIHRAHQENLEHYWTVDPAPEGSRSYQVLDHDGQVHGYFALTEQEDATELEALVNVTGAKGVGTAVLDYLRDRDVKLNAFEPPLAAFYQAQGFRVDERVAFDEQYAPPYWHPEFGRPDVVFMSRPRFSSSCMSTTKIAVAA